jgi:hypothetical protein
MLLLLNIVSFPTGLEHGTFGGGATETVLHPAVLAAVLVAIVAIVCLPRRFQIAVFLCSSFLIPSWQQLLVGHLHVFVQRVIILAGCVILLMFRRPARMTVLAGGWNSIDRMFVLWIGSHVLAFTILYADSGAVVNQLGYVWDYLGAYILLRHLIRTEEDATTAVKWLAYLAIILAVCMVREQLTGQNIFGAFGGGRLLSEIREGRIRSQGVFRHPILAGTFAATLVPLLLWLWHQKKTRPICVAGLMASVVMTATTACSTPIATYAAGIMGLCFWPLRKGMRVVRWGLVMTLIGLHLVMKWPVWALIGHIGLVQGSSSHHRYELVDQFIRHASDWWLIGTQANADWGSEMVDTSNAYVAEGTAGGGLALICFIALIACCFSRLGTARKSLHGEDRQREWFLWSLGACLFAHVIAFFGIYYFDQMRVAWFALLAMISAVTSAQPVESVGPAKPPVTHLSHPLAFARYQLQGIRSGAVDYKRSRKLPK